MSKTLDRIQTLKGFKDYLPREASVRHYIIRQLLRILETYNFDLMDTPVLEYSELLFKKGGDEVSKQTYRFKDQGSRDVVMRFDLTVPFARFISTHRSHLKFPFKRSQLGKVYRGEKSQKGRYREFMQVDFDIVGDDSFRCDAEILSVVFYCLSRIFLNSIKDKDKKFVVHYSHLGVLISSFEQLGIRENFSFIMRTIDKIDKIGLDGVKEILLEGGLVKDQADSILRLVNLQGSFDSKIAFLENIIGQNEHLKRVKDIFCHLRLLEIQDFFNLNLKIVRGLDYYTGIVFETEIFGSNMGSVCSGGRYDNLISSFSTSSDKISGVGGSFGIDRIKDIIKLKQFNYIQELITKLRSRILILNLESDLQDYYYKLANKLRSSDYFQSDYFDISGVYCEVYFKNANGNNIKKQIDYAKDKQIRFLIFIGKEEYKRNKIGLWDLKKKEKEELLLSFEELVKIIKDNQKSLYTSLLLTK